MYFILCQPNHTPQNYNCIFFSVLYKTTRAVNQSIWLSPCISFFFLTRIFKVVFFPLNASVLMGSFCLLLTGAENGASSQGAVGQSGPVASSTGGVSKASKGQGSAEKEEQAGNQKRARRQWESWSAEDKNSFFEGLYEVKGRN